MNLRAQPARFLAAFFLAFAVSLSLDFLAGHPRGVDEPMELGLWCAIILQLFLWISGMLSWGSLFWRWSNKKASECPTGVSLAIGSLAYALVCYMLATVGLLRPEVRFFLFILQSVGIALATPRKITVDKFFLLGLLPLVLLVLLLFIDALIISSYWDPLHHQLSSVRLFWERGRMYFPRDAIASYQEGGFEMLFLWPHFLFAHAGGKGLLPVQIFSQLTHLTVGFIGSIAIAQAFAKRWLPSSPWQAIGVLMFAIPSSLQFAIPTAKNDWGIVLWVLAGLWLITSPAQSESRSAKAFRFICAGMLWGFAFLAKLSCGFALAGLCSVFLFRNQRNPRELALFALGGLLGAAPLMFRNFHGTGDPFFPLFPQLFHLSGKVMGPTWHEALSRYNAQPLGFSRLREWGLEFPLASSCLLLPLLAFIRKEDLALRASALAIPVGALLFCFFTGKATELRLAGALLPLSALVLTVLMQKFTTRIPVSNTGIGWVLLGALALAMPYRWEAWQRSRAIPYNNLLVRGYVSGEAQGWIRDHYVFGMKTALLSESRFYHSIPFQMIRIWDAPALDTKLRAAPTPADFLRVLKQEGYTHLILSQEKLDVFYPKEQVAQVEGYIFQHPQALVFQSHYSAVADLSKF